MATVGGPSVARHSSPFRRASKPVRSSTAPTQPAPADPYYGHEETAKICTNFVTHLFACPELPPISTTHPTAPSPRLDLFIAYALHRTRLHTSVTFAALYLLRRLKARFPAARGSSGHRLFISAFMLASKVICDDTYSNKSWSIVGQGMFALREINQMEREMCSYLEWQLNVEPIALKEFEERVRKDFKGPGPYPNYVLPSPAPSPMPSTTPYAVGAPTPAPSFVTGRAPSTSPPKPVPRSTAPPENNYITPPSSPSTCDTPEATHSASTSPASSISPPTPPGAEDLSAKIATPNGSVPISIEPHVVPKPAHSSHSHSHSQARTHAPAARSQTYPPPRPREPVHSNSLPSRKVKCDLFAYAAPVNW